MDGHNFAKRLRCSERVTLRAIRHAAEARLVSWNNAAAMSLSRHKKCIGFY